MNQPLRIELDDFRCTVLDMGRLALDGGAMFGVVPKTMWSRLVVADAENRIPLGMNVLLVEWGSEKILIDTGIGEKFSEKYRRIYAVEPHSMETALTTVGLTTTDITQVVFTHLHFDHAGGATRALADGTIVPTFENARYVVHRGEWDYGCCPHERCKASYLKENLEPMQRSGRLRLLDGDTNELVPGLTLHVTGGHTPYHQIAVLQSTSGGLVYWGDLLPTRHHIRIPFVMGYDEYPVETMAAKREWLARAVAAQWLHVFEHDFEMPVCRLFPTERPDEYRAEALSGRLEAGVLALTGIGGKADDQGSL